MTHLPKSCSAKKNVQGEKKNHPRVPYCSESVFCPVFGFYYYYHLFSSFFFLMVASAIRSTPDRRAPCVGGLIWRHLGEARFALTHILSQGEDVKLN